MTGKATKIIAFFLFALLFLCVQVKAKLPHDSTALALMEDTWREFRKIHPFSFQTVALKHRGDTCVFVMSEPAPWVKSKNLEELFLKYGGHLIIGRQPFGYDGALYDAIGYAVLDSVRFKRLEEKLFIHLYGTDYKPYYTDLDNPSPHVYFSDINLNYDFFPTVRELETTLFYSNRQYKSFDEIRKSDSIQLEKFKVDFENFKRGRYHKSLESLKKQASAFANKLYYSKQRGFVVWRIYGGLTNKDCPLARQFALDTDLIVHAFKEGDFVYVVGRERQIPLTILPPLRSETIILLTPLFGTSRVVINPDRAIKDTLDDVHVWNTPINMSQELQNTEMGNLMVLTDMMLKAWSENAMVKDWFINYPHPKTFFTEQGVAHALNYEPQYEWIYLKYFNTRTGSLYPNYKIKGDSTTFGDKDLIIKASRYFSELNNTDLVRMRQYAVFNSLFYNPLTRHTSESTPWLQTPSATVSNRPWGYGGYMTQSQIITAPLRVAELLKRGITVPVSIQEIAKAGTLPAHISTAIANEQKWWEAYQRAEAACKAGQITKEQLNATRRKYSTAKSQLTTAFGTYKVPTPLEPIIPQATMLLTPHMFIDGVLLRTPVKPQTADIGHDRGFVPQLHKVSPTTKTQESTATQETETLPDWQERLRNRINNKIHKINSSQTKWGLYMIYGHIFDINTNTENTTNYAA